MERLRSRLKVAAFWAIAVALCGVILFIGMEGMLRVLIHHTLAAEAGSPLVRSSVPGLNYRLASNSTTGNVQTDSHGLRVRAADPQPVRHRVLLVGDSIAYGMGVPYAKSLAPLLEADLTEGSGERTAVWNAGVPGYNTVQEAITLDDIGPVVRPDLVIVQFCMNDYLDAPTLAPNGILDATNAHQGSDTSVLSLAYRSRTLVFFRDKLRDLEQVRPEWFPVWAHYIHYVQNKPGWARAKAALVRMNQSAQRLNARLLVVIFPVEQQLRIGDRAAQNDLLAFTQAHEIKTLDLYDGFHAEWRSGLFVNYWARQNVVDKLHPNERGHALAAHEIAKAVLSQRDAYFGQPQHGAPAVEVNAAQSKLHGAT